MIIIGYYGVGKTTFIEKHPEIDAFDLNSIGGKPSLWLLNRNLDHTYVLADPLWLETVQKSGLPYRLVIPSKDRKYEFLYHFMRRTGNCAHGPLWCNEIEKKWDSDLDGLMKVTGCTVTILSSEGQFLDDIL